MLRKIIQINEAKCNGCGICAQACHEGAIAMVNGIAKLMRDDYCDGLGDCLPTCPTQAISFIEREAEAFNEIAVQEHKKKLHGDAALPSMHAMPLQLQQWPIQIKLVPISAPYFKDAKLLIAADCSAFAYANFHSEFIKGRITLIGCPKLDNIDYHDKLSEIIRQNNIRDILVVRMQVPCCGGIEHAVVTALNDSGKMIPCNVITISTDGKIVK